MATFWEGLSTKNKKPNLKLDGKKIIVEKIGCYDGSTEPASVYTKEVIYHFKTEDKAKEYYYKKR